MTKAITDWGISKTEDWITTLQTEELRPGAEERPSKGEGPSCPRIPFAGLSKQKLSRETQKPTINPTGIMLSPGFTSKMRKMQKEMEDMGSTQINIKNDGRFKAFYQFPFCTQKKSRLPPCAGKSLPSHSEGELGHIGLNSFSLPVACNVIFSGLMRPCP